MAAVERGRVWDVGSGGWSAERRRRGTWRQMDSIETQCLEKLGWTAESWNNKAPPFPDEIAWELLDARQCSHAAFLGLNRQAWAGLWSAGGSSSDEESESSSGDEAEAPGPVDVQMQFGDPAVGAGFGLTPSESEALGEFLNGVEIGSSLVAHAAAYFELLRDNRIDMHAIAVAEAADWADLGIPVEDGLQLTAAAQHMNSSGDEFAAQWMAEEQVQLELERERASEQEAASLALVEELREADEAASFAAAQQFQGEEDGWSRGVEQTPSELVGPEEEADVAQQQLSGEEEASTGEGAAAAGGGGASVDAAADGWQPVKPELSKRQRKRQAAKLKQAAQRKAAAAGATPAAAAVAVQPAAAAVQPAVEEAFGGSPKPERGHGQCWSEEVKLIEASDCDLVEGPDKANIRAVEALDPAGGVTVEVNQRKLVVTIEAPQKAMLEQAAAMLSLAIRMVPVPKKVFELMLSADLEDDNCRMTSTRAEELWFETGARVSWDKGKSGGGKQKNKGNGRRKGGGASSATAYQFTVQGVESKVDACVLRLQSLVSDAQEALERRNSLNAERAAEAKAAKELAAKQAAEELAARELALAEEEAARKKAAAKKKKREKQAAKKKQEAAQEAERKRQIEILAKERAAEAQAREAQETAMVCENSFFRAMYI